MKRIITLCLALSFLFSYTVQAQLPDGSTAPDFTATDLDGVEHNLYDILESGKTVILDISATWCGPCWSYHQGGTLETLWEDYGPDGTDELRVFMIEGDASTNTDCLYGTAGCVGGTTGDWVTGTHYPIIDDASIANAYQIAYYPTIYTICPDKIVTESGQASAANHYAIIGECAVEFGVNNAKISNLVAPTTICDGELAFTPELDLTNLGSADLTAVEIQVYFDGAEVGAPYAWSGAISTLASEHVVMDEVTVPGSGEVSVEVVTVNGEIDDDPNNNALASNINAITTELNSDTLYFSMMTDGYGEEIYWELLDFDGNIIQWGGNELACAGCQQYPNLSGGYDDNTLIEETIVVPADGCYNFHIIDDYGDGLLSGFWRVDDKFGTTVFEGTGAFTDVDNPFRDEFQPVSNTEITGLSSLKLFPTPASDYMTVRFNLNEATNLGVAIYNTLGQQVISMGAETYVAGNNDIPINTVDLTNGVYIVTLQSDTQSISRKFTVSK